MPKEASIQGNLKSFLDAQGRLTGFPAKRKRKIYVLFYLAKNSSRIPFTPNSRSMSCCCPGTPSLTPLPCGGSCMTIIFWTEAPMAAATV